MRRLDFSRYVLSSCVAAALLAGCGGSQPPISAPGAMTQSGAVTTQTQRGGSWMLPEAKSKKRLYVSDYQGGSIDIFSVPKYSLVGQITDGIYDPEGLATNKIGDLYVANLAANTITVYKPGTTSPSLTLTESGGPTDVAVGKNGYVYAGDYGGGIDVYPPGATSPIRRLTNAALRYGVTGVGVGASNSVYATGFSNRNSTGPAMVKFAHAHGSGSNLGLTGLVFPFGVIIDKNDNLVVTDAGYYYGQGAILVYPSGQKSPSEKTTMPNPAHSAINKPENLIYVPEGHYGYNGVNVYDYPSLTLVTTIPTGEHFLGGAALSPAPTP
jgi:hypothetical protein